MNVDSESSLRDDLAAGLAEISAREAEPVAAETPTEPVAVEPVADAVEREDGRDEKGRFKPKEAKEDEPAAVEPEAAPEAAKEPVAEVSPLASPPSSWRADEAAEWANLPDTAKAAIVRREAAISKLTGAQDSERTFGREFAEIVRPHMEVIQKFGVTPQFAVQALLANDRVMRSGTPEQKVELARRMMADYGLDPVVLAQPDPNMPSDPHMRQMQDHIRQLEARLSPTQQQAEFSPLPPSQEEATIHADIEAFRADPAHPHFDQVRDQMARLLETEAAPDMASAYRMAVAADATLSLTPPATAETRQAPEKAAAARRASLSVVGSPGPSGDPAPQSLREELKENLRQFGFMPG